MTATGKFLKRAWVRDANAPIGQPAMGKINCPCGQCPPSWYNESQPDIVCACGVTYTWDGWIVQEAEQATPCGTLGAKCTEDASMNTFNIFQGDKVTGRYYGEDFAGTVAYTYPHTTMPETVIMVQLDHPITVYGSERQGVCVYVLQDGTARSGHGEMSITSHRRPGRREELTD